ncbi:unnamed protein product [Alternaria alternata]
MDYQNKLRVIIVGSGLAGLTAARILREHHHVTVYEREDQTAATGGQGISISPNAVKILERIGYDREKAGAVPIYGYRSYDKEGNVKKDHEVDLKTRYGADQLTQKRSDFRDELMRLATAPSVELEIKGNPAHIVYDTKVVDLDAEEGRITLGDGTTAEADVVIDAVKEVLGGSLPHWWEPTTAQNRVCILNDGSDRFVAAYPLRHHKYMNFSCIFPSRMSKQSNRTNSWSADANSDEIIEIFHDFEESFRKILSIATEVKYWELQELDALPTWTRGRAIVIGDAAHAMPPLQGQGANQAVEDGESFRLLEGVEPRDVPKALKQIDSLRRPRATQVQEDTRNMAGEVSWEDRMAKYDFLYSYNGIREA